MRRFPLLAFAAVVFAADLPPSNGYVNDFAGRLTPSERVALDNKVRQYERATSNEIAVAIVTSLDGKSVEEYANRLFRAWGVGKKDRNNGVLLLWAPAERKVRIEVGLGLEGAIPNPVAAGLAREVTSRFRQEDYIGGLNAGVDGIIARLDAAAPATAGSEPVPITEVPPEPEKKTGLALLISGVLVAGLIGLIVMLWRRNQAKIAASLPPDLDHAVAGMAQAEEHRKQAAAALEALRQEAPPQVWEDLAGAVENAPRELAGLQAELDKIRGMPHQDAAAAVRAHRMLDHWRDTFSRLWDRLQAVGSRLDSFRYCRDRSQLMMGELRDALDQRGTGWGSGARFLTAAGETYGRALAAAALNPVNWLLVYDLLGDTRECLLYADDPSRYRRSQVGRNWDGSADLSPAMMLMMTQSSVSASSSDSSSSWVSSGGADSGGGGFGGGDTGGGGGSSSY